MPKNSILYKIVIVFIVISVLPLAVFEYFASKNFETTVYEVLEKTEEMGRNNLQSAHTIGSMAIEDAVSQLDKKSTEVIELRTIELASRIADFLTERDHDVLNLALSHPSPELYLRILETNRRNIILPVDTSLDRPDDILAPVLWENANNQTSWRHTPPVQNNVISKPLYKEITFVGLDGVERIKVRDGEIANNLTDVGMQANTYCKAEDYFKHAVSLKRNELYVSKVIGAYVKGWLYKDGDQIRVKEQSAYAGKENIDGEKFTGIIRWVTPVYEQDKKIGYLTVALDHAHVMEFTDHIVPTEERFTAVSDAGSGNYAFLWDCDHQSISHPRDFFICGYDPATGQEVPGWLSQETYNEYKKGILPLDEFIGQLPDFRGFANTKKGSIEQQQDGMVGLDCRVLDHAPQCEGWSRGTEDGGAGSFLISWSGLWKLTTYASIPYHTGQYSQSPRGFGYVTIGANVEDFHQAANTTKKNIEASLQQQEHDIASIHSETQKIISANFSTHRQQGNIIFLITITLTTILALYLGLILTRTLRRMNKSVQAIGDGDYDQHIEVQTRDEIGQLGDSFNKMAQDIDATNKCLRKEISERLKTEQALLISEKNLRDIFESALEGIFQATLDGNLISANPRMATIFGYDSAEEMVKEITDTGTQLYVDPSHRQEYVAKLVSEGELLNNEAELQKKNGDMIWVSMNVRAVCDDDQNPQYLEGFVVDISQRKNVEKEQEALHERLVRSKKMEALGLLAGGVAHDLNNVLAGIVGYPQLLLTQLPEDSPMKKKLIAIQHSGMKAADIVQDLLAMARRGVKVSEVININDILGEEMGSLKQMAQEHDRPDVSIKTTLAPALMNIKGSSVHLKKTIMNLFSNALDALIGDGEISIVTENKYVDIPLDGYDEICEGDFVVLTIKDNGAGIDADAMKSIFEPFYSTKTMGRSGTGLGMAVVWGTVQDHGGYINVESVVGEGTVIQLYFPVTREEVSAKKRVASLAEYTGNGETILVVDDMAEQRELADSLLTKLNYKVKTVVGGNEAVKYVKKHQVDLLVLDMIMPSGLDGLDTYKQILKLHPEQKAIIASGYSENDRIDETLRLGAGTYIRKPYTLEKIGIAVRDELAR